jgi:hypothetical protein
MRDTGCDHFMGRNFIEVFIFHPAVPGAGRQQTGNHPHQRGFTGTVRTDHGHGLAGCDGETDIEQGLETAVTGIEMFYRKHDDGLRQIRRQV